MVVFSLEEVIWGQSVEVSDCFQSLDSSSMAFNMVKDTAKDNKEKERGSL